ncbi:MAG: hypothetical protein ABIP16_08775 [Thermomonas sp.]
MTRFDDTLRGHHDASLHALSPRVRAQLAQRRHAVMRGATATRYHRFGYAAALAALCALAIGLQFRNPPSPAWAAPAAVATTTRLVPARADSTMLDQDPDFYAWLASADAMQVAME